MTRKKIEKKVKKPASKLKETGAYSCVLDCAGNKYETKGETIVECLEKLKPTIIKSRSILNVSKGELKSTPISLSPFQVKKMMVNKINREILQKRLLISFKITCQQIMRGA